MANDKWLPTLVDTYRQLLKFNCGYTLKSNIIYNLQYLEYLLHSLNDNRDNLTSNLISMHIKSYLICFISVVEAIFYIELSNRKLLPFDEYEKISQQDMFSNVDGIDLKTSTLLYKKVEPFNIDIKMDWLIKKVEKNSIYPTLEHNNFAKIKVLKRLRNKVHLHLAEIPDQSDFNSFTYRDVDLANEVLLNILEFYSTNDSLLCNLPFSNSINK